MRSDLSVCSPQADQPNPDPKNLRIKGEVIAKDDNKLRWTAPNLFAGSILDLEPGTEYEVKLTLKDPDGGNAEKILTAKTRSEPVAFEGGRKLHVYPPEFQVLNVMSSAGASILAVGYVLPLVYMIWSLRYGAVAGKNPWRARGLEWETLSPPPTDNFEVTPLVTAEAYAYDVAEPEALYSGRPAHV